MTSTEAVEIRFEREGDEATVERLAALDSARVPARPLLLAARDGSVLAALSLATGAHVADPFAPTADLVALLEVRARHAGARGAGARIRDRLLLWERPWARARPGHVA